MAHQLLTSRLLDVARVDKQKRRLTGFLNKIALKDSTYRHLKTLTNTDLRKMAEGFLRVRMHLPTALRCSAKVHASAVIIVVALADAQEQCLMLPKGVNAFPYCIVLLCKLCGSAVIIVVALASARSTVCDA